MEGRTRTHLGRAPRRQDIHTHSPPVPALAMTMNLKSRKVDEKELPGWSSDRTLWQSLRNLTQGLSWKKVPLAINSAAAVPDDRRGAYLIAAAAPASALKPVGAYTVLYVGSVTGSSRSIRARFKEHVRTPAPLLRQFRRCCGSTDFWFTRVDDEARIYELESLLKMAFNPPCNINDPPGTFVIRAIIRDGVPLTRDTHALP